ncbi:hypothetical protein GOP47_0014950 [Adiantum capillus-veneris]|uniref:Uncharacterized protein n=1 Tax=Adiantum capillus-veneris TaxID=13818 RepID=A0A9D4UN02_ADICA|nr:hypothetical protein GOP47_0031213 [Adiantum capillus-veneris]KAI5070607.1 hypothetical protein GOP47_0014950 [Adiantum capillus-veneris]
MVIQSPFFCIVRPERAPLSRFQVPHSIKPEAQLVELAIEKFIPRVKSKQKVVQTVDPSAVDLNPEESLILRRYFNPHQAASDRWKPSLIAFPHCQLLPTQVHNVRHSEKTTSMLIDTLQSLHEFKTRRRDDNEVCEFDGKDSENLHKSISEQDDLKGDDSTKEDGDIGNDDLFLAEQDDTNHMNPPTTELEEASYSSVPNNGDDDVLHGFHGQQHDVNANGVSPHPKPFFGEAQDIGSMTLNPAQVIIDVDGIEGRCTDHCPTEKVTIMGEEDCLRVSIGHCKSHFPNSVGKHVQPLPPDCHTNCGLSTGDDFHAHVEKFRQFGSASEGSYRYSQGIVSVDALGFVQVASPPMLPLRTSLLKQLDTGINTMLHSFLSIQRELPMTNVQRRLNSATEKQNVDPGFEDTPASKTPFATKPRDCYYVASTPEEEMSSSSLHEKDDKDGCEDGVDDDSPRLCTLAEQGVVPLSPGLESNFSLPVEESTDRIKHSGNALNDMSSTPQIKENPQPLCGLTLLSTADKFKKIGDSEFKPDNQIIDDTQLTRALSAIKVCDGRREAKKLSENLETPVLQQSDGSNWNHSLEASSSAQKPRRFRRLCKAKETSKRLSRELQPLELLNRCPGKEKLCASDHMKKRAGKQKLCFAAALLVDEEAEVSSGEDVSTDEDDEDDEQGSLQDFIDDQVEPTVGASEGTDEPIDMMAVYRKSLLTQSPLDECPLPWMQHRLQRTPISGDGNFTLPNCSESVLSVSSDSHGEVDPGSATINMRELRATPTVSNHPSICTLETREPTRFTSSQKEGVPGQLHSSMHSTTKVHERKRKLSFQQEQSMTRNLSGHFDDDLFAGLDLDALEVEAVQKSRSHFLGNSAPQPEAATRLVPKQSCNNDADLDRKQDEDFEFFPSFNLGIDC